MQFSTAMLCVLYPVELVCTMVRRILSTPSTGPSDVVTEHPVPPLLSMSSSTETVVVAASDADAVSVAAKIARVEKTRPAASRKWP